MYINTTDKFFTQFNSFYNDILSKQEILSYGNLRIREIFPSRLGYTMQFQLKPEYAILENNDKKIKLTIKIAFYFLIERQKPNKI